MDTKRDNAGLHFIDDSLLDLPNRMEIAVIGVGGTGSRMLNNLARINYALKGLGKTELFVTAFDNDIVTRNNIGRQLFFEEDLGLNKAAVTIERINFAYGLDWISVETKFLNDNDYSSFNNEYSRRIPHIIISCVDNVSTRVKIDKKLNCNSAFNCKYWLDIGNGKDFGQIVLSYHGNIAGRKNLLTLNQLTGGDFNKLKDEKEKDNSCSLALSLGKQSLFINSILAEYASNMLFTLLNDYIIDYNGIYVNLSNMETNKIPIA